MRLNKLILQGFKSFVDRTEIRFDSGITGIVGPNGCGKSNIVDAVRWVLGEQSAKTLRGGKMEDIIFNGSEKRRRLSFCEVTLEFDNSDHSIPVDYSEVSVTRRVYRSGEGEYKINGAPCRLKDIVDLFRDTGVGKEGYSLIGQGRIDDILSQRSEDRRQVFEEAAGIGRYKARKTDAEKRLQRTEENLTRIDDTCEGLEERLGPLEVQSTLAREYLSLRDELKILELNAFLVRSGKYIPRIDEAKQRVKAYQEHLEELAERQRAMETERGGLHEEFERCEAISAGQNETVQQLIGIVEALEGEIRVAEERAKSAGERKNALEAETLSLRQGTAGGREALQTVNERILWQESDLREEEIVQQRQERELKSREEELDGLEKTAEEKKQKIIQAMNAYGDVKVRRERMQTMHGMLTEQLSRAENELREQQDRIPALEELESSTGRTLSEQKREQERHQSELAGVKDALSQKRAEEEKNKKSQEKLDIDLARLKSTQKLLMDMQRDYEGYYSSVRQVMLQAKRIRSKGVHGVVADVLRVPKEYERAIDMALGNSLQYIIVDDAEDAKYMIEYLRSNRFGRATFYPISAIRRRDMSINERKVLSLKGCVGVASELIAFDPIYQDIVSNLLGRTVIARDLDSGIVIQRAGNYQFRVVTLEGDVMHSGGSMTGGSLQSKATSLLSRQREIKESAVSIQTGEEDRSKLQKARSVLLEEIASLEKRDAELRETLHSEDLLIQRGEDALRSVLEERKSFERKREAMEEELAKMRAQIQDIEHELELLRGQSSRAKTSTADQQEEVRLLQEEIYQRRREVEELRTSVGNARIALTAKQRDHAALVEDRDRLQRDTNASGEVLAARQTELERCLEQLSDLKEEIGKVRASAGEQRKRLDEARKDYRAAEAQRTETLAREQGLNAELDKLRADVAEITENVHRTELLLSRLEQEFKQMQDRIWEDYQLTYAGAKEFEKPDFKLTESDKRVSAIRQRIREMGAINVGSIDEYRQVSERLTDLNAQRTDLRTARDDLFQIIHDLETRMQRKFRSELEKINENFGRTFTALFGGGTARISLEDPHEALTCGIDISVQPPGKKLQMLSLLSGGERALTAIAILFAILDLKPTPFCLLDEIEAALDDANIDTYAEYLLNYSRETQFIVITHRKGTMQRCNSLYGVVMEEKGISRTVSVSLNEAVG